MRLAQRHRVIFWKALLDITLILIGFQAAYLAQIFFGSHDFQNGLAFFRFQLSLLYALIFVLAAQRLELYKNRASLFNIKEKAGLMRAIFTTTVLFMALNGLLHFIYSMWDLVITSFVLLAFLGVARHFLFKAHHRKYLEGRHERKVLIYGAGEAGRLLFKKMYFMEGGDYSLVGFLDDTLEPGTELSIQRARSKARPFTAKILGGFGDMGRLIREHSIHQIIIAMPSVAVERILEVMQACIANDVRYAFVPHLYKLRLEQVGINNMGDIPLLKKRSFNIGFFFSVVKRMFDFSLSAFLLVCLLPLFPLLALLVKLGSRGPVFFRQKRVGKEGRLFTMYKFRTMSTKTPIYMPSPSSNEPTCYISKIGSFLRDTNLDETPQLWNVLKGDMSIVGPRPEMPFHVANYDEVQRDRLKVKPGLTGMWQISPDRNKEIHDNIDYDLYYINNMSFFVDLILVVETLLLTLAAVANKVRSFLFGAFSLKANSASSQNKEGSLANPLQGELKAPTPKRALP